MINIRSLMCEQNQQHRGYHCSQLFGYRSRSEKTIEEDDITALKFDHSGKLLALGDKAGRLIVFTATGDATPTPEYDYYFEFQSHQREFDTLKNLNIGEEISHINWLRPQEKYQKILTSNSNTIKLWKIFEKQEKRMVKATGQDLSFPHFQIQQPTMSVNLKKTFPNKNFCPFNSVNLSKNQEFIFTTDQSNILLWSIEHTSKPYILKQFSHTANNRIEKSQKITCSQIHPETETMFIFGTNKGVLAFNDIRTSVNNCNTLNFNCQHDESNFLSQIINQYSSVMFLEGTRKIVTRDLISVKVWDMCNTTKPISSQYIDQNIKSRLCDLFQADSLDDKFNLTNAKGKVMTGNYSNSFHLIGSESQEENVQYQLSYDQQTYSREVGGITQHRNDFNSSNKVLSHDYNRITEQLAVSTHNCFFIYSKEEASLD